MPTSPVNGQIIGWGLYGPKDWEERTAFRLTPNGSSYSVELLDADPTTRSDGCILDFNAMNDTG